MTEFEKIDLCILCNLPASSLAKEFDSSRRRDHLSNKKLKSSHSNSVGTSTSFNENDGADLLPQLRVIFLLQQIFKCPIYDESTLQVMRALGDPAEWFQICDGCSDLVDHGMDVFRKLKMVEAQYSEIQKKLESKVALSKSRALEEKGVMTDELTETSRIRLDFRSKLREGIEGVLNCEIKTEPVPDPVSYAEDHWTPCDDGFTDDIPSPNSAFTESLVHESRSFAPLNDQEKAKPLRGKRKRSKLAPQALLVNRPRLRQRAKKKVQSKWVRTKTRKKRVGRLCKEDSSPESDDEDIDNRPKKRRCVTKKGKSKVSKMDKDEVEADEAAVEPNLSCDDEDDPDFSPSDDDDEDIEGKEDGPFPNSCKQKRETPDQSSLQKQLKADFKLFLEKGHQYLDMSLVEYPPQSEEDKAKIPKLLKVGKAAVKLEDGQIKRGGLPCPSCKRSFSHRFQTIAHMHRFHFGIARPWKCNHCKFTAATTRVLRRHLLRHQEGNLKICKICDYSCRSKPYMDNHVISHQRKVANPTCSECSDSFDSFQKFTKHMMEEHGFEYPYPVQNPPRKIVCELCSKLCSSPRELEFHKMRRHNEPPSKKFPVCSECSKIFFSESSLKSHMENRHNPQGSSAVFCEHCGKDFKNLDLLRNHKAFWHVEEPEPCRLCGMEQRNSIDLRQHMSRNHKEAVGMSPEELEEYAKKKREEMEFKCPLCPEKFAFRVQLYHHYRSNHEEVTNKFKCDICGKGFSRQSSVRRHYESNHMQLKINCEDCGKAFPKDSLWQHRRYWCAVKKQREQEGPPSIPEMKINLPVEKGPEDHHEPGPSLETEFKEWFQPPVVSNVSLEDNGVAGTHVLDVSHVAPFK